MSVERALGDTNPCYDCAPNLEPIPCPLDEVSPRRPIKTRIRPIGECSEEWVRVACVCVAARFLRLLLTSFVQHTLAMARGTCIVHG